MVEKSKVIGIMLQHSDGDKEYYEPELLKEDIEAIFKILEKYGDDNDSIRGDLKVIDQEENAEDIDSDFEHTSKEMADKLMEFNRDFSDDSETIAEEAEYLIGVFDKLKKSEDFNILAHRNRVTEPVECENPFVRSPKEREYMLLNRLQLDCKYYINCAGKCRSSSLWSDIDTIIKEMENIMDSFTEEEKPEWLTDADFEALKNEIKEIQEHEAENVQ